MGLVRAAVLMVARADARRHWKGIAVVTILVGLVGAVVLVTAAGARRTSTSLDRFRAASRAADLQVVTGVSPPAARHAFAQSAGVAAVGVLYQFTMTKTGNDNLPITAAIDDRFGDVVDRPRVLSGRLPHPNEVDAVAIGEKLSQTLHARVGQSFTLGSYSPADDEKLRAGQPVNASGPKITMKVVGLVRRPLDLAGRADNGGMLTLTPAFYERYQHQIGTFAGNVLRVRLQSPEDRRRVEHAARQLFAKQPIFTIEPLDSETSGASHAINVLAVALTVFALIAAIAGAVFLAIVITRQLASVDADQSLLAALGLSRRQRATAIFLPSLSIVAGGTVLAVGGATLASPLLPFGIARRADPDPGFHFDAVVLGSGFLVIALLTLVLVAYSSWRTTREFTSASTARSAERPSRIARSARAAGLAPTTTTGLSLALEPGRGRRAVPVRSAVTGAAIGAAGLAAVIVFASSFNLFRSSPREYGWTFDAIAHARDNGNGETASCVDAPAKHLDTRTLAAVTLSCQGSVTVEHQPVTSWSFSSLRGDIEPEIISGRAPAAADEVVLGQNTLRKTRSKVGGTVTIAVATSSYPYKIVGVGVAPSPASFDSQPLGESAIFTGEGYQRLVRPDDETNASYFVRLAPDVHVAQLADLPDFGNAKQLNDTVALELPVAPAEVKRLDQVSRLPMFLGAFFAFLALVAIAHALVTTVRRRRSDLAILQSLGFSRRQVHETIGWQATSARRDRHDRRDTTRHSARPLRVVSRRRQPRRGARRRGLAQPHRHARGDHPGRDESVGSPDRRRAATRSHPAPVLASE